MVRGKAKKLWKVIGGKEVFGAVDLDGDKALSKGEWNKIDAFD